MRELITPYFEVFGNTGTIRELATAHEGENIIGLRHDVDYCIDTALKMAWLEHQNGIYATYYILHSADYMSDPDLFAKCRQIQEFGHEVGLHTNMLAQWYRGEIEDPATVFSGLLERFRGEGIDVTGVAAHGDPACYAGQFTNYWLFDDICPSPSFERERGIVAEGSKAPENHSRTITYPEDRHHLAREDGAIFEFWSWKLADFGLDYEASRIEFEGYYSDSGGKWAGDDPLGLDLSVGRHQVLLHPWHWRGEQKHTYFAGPARSGTKWLAHLLQKASTVTAEHEVTLNRQAISAEPPAYKNTASRLDRLLSSGEEIDDLVAIARSYSESLNTDYAEANIYLSEVLAHLPHGPDTRIVHIIRDPRDVVRSLWQREWYSVPQDPNHPRMDIEGWDEFSQLEQICWYVRRTHEKIMVCRDHCLKFEEMTSDRNALANALSEIEIGLCPLLAAPFFAKPQNATPKWDLEQFGQWAEEDKAVFYRILGALTLELGYGIGDVDPAGLAVPGISVPEKPDQGEAERPPVVLLNHALLPGRDPLTLFNVSLEGGGYAFSSRVVSYMLLSGGAWTRKHVAVRPMSEGVDSEATTSEMFRALGGWPAAPRSIYTIDIKAELKGTPIRLICLSHDENGHLVDQKDLGVLSERQPDLRRHFRPARRAKRFNLALFTDAKTADSYLSPDHVRLVIQAEDRTASKKPDELIKSIEGIAASQPASVGILPQIKIPGPTAVPLWNAELGPTDGSTFVENAPDRSHKSPDHECGPDPSGVARSNPKTDHTFWERALAVSPIAVDKACFFIFSGSQWRNGTLWALENWADGVPHLFQPETGQSMAGHVTALPHNAAARVSVFALNHNVDGQLVCTCRLGIVSATQRDVVFHLSPGVNTGYWSVALHASAGMGGFDFSVRGEGGPEAS